MDSLYLYQQIEAVKNFGALKELPEVISSNLAPQIVLREYQEEAFRYFATYWSSSEFRKNKQSHVLFHMATGSGKTVMMAGLICFLYSQGYRKFLFFVNQTNVLEKTKDNFLNPNSSKYLFSDNIMIGGKRVPINAVNNFSQCDSQAINLCFTTTQKLHLDLFLRSENSLTIDDFEDDKVVLISDESHHINSRTKKASKDEEEEDRSWECSVYSALHANRDNVMLEFTATTDLKDKNVESKYRDKIIYDYPLAKFRASGYTKDFQNFQSQSTPWQRTLQALIMSEYRRALFADAMQNIKPVVLLKSQKIAESKEFYDEFFKRLNQLTVDDINELNGGEDLLSEALQYFKEKDATLHSLVSALQTGFGEDRAIIMNGSTDSNAEKQLLVNSLEDITNPYRIIFTVDMLNEGWDVLNLFDIVRLYDTRQGSGKAGKPGNYTIKEAQLIGRGARYFPYQMNAEQERFKRKYDNDIKNRYRLLETLLYHSQQDSRYIAELKQALKETGFLPEESIEREYVLKDEIKGTDFFQHGIVFSNKKVPKDRSRVTQLPENIRNLIIRIQVGKSHYIVYDLFDDEAVKVKNDISWDKLALKKLSEAPYNIVSAASERFEGLKFNLLKNRFPNLRSMREFLTDKQYCGNITIQIDGPENYVLSAKDWEKACANALRKVEKHVLAIKGEYEGSKVFTATFINAVLRNKTITLSEIKDEGLGASQNSINSPELQLDLNTRPWFVYTDNYGTTEEKKFVCYFDSIVEELYKKYEEIYLVRNERIPQLAIYSFDTGERFEPDYLLFLRHKKSSSWEQEQIYIEPKGTHLLEKDSWKEKFLLSLDKEAIPHKTYADDVNYRIIGLPFFNSDKRLDEFGEAISKFYDVL